MDGQGKRKGSKKRFYAPKRQKTNGARYSSNKILCKGLAGLLITCANGMERQATMDALHIADDYGFPTVLATSNSELLGSKQVAPECCDVSHDDNQATDDGEGVGESKPQGAAIMPGATDLNLGTVKEAIVKEIVIADNIKSESSVNLSCVSGVVENLNDKGSIDVDCDDIERSLKAECHDLKSYHKSMGDRLNCQDSNVDLSGNLVGYETGVKNVSFVGIPAPSDSKLDVVDVNKFVTTLFDDVVKSKVAKSRHILRLMPIMTTCKAEVDQIVAKVYECLHKLIPKDTKVTFGVQVKVRNNTGMVKKLLIEAVCMDMKSMYPYLITDLNDPDYLITLEVLKTICCVGILYRFKHYRKYNLLELGVVSNVDSNVESVDKKAA